MKESKALEKICPLMSGEDPSTPFVLCQGEECMMWVTTYRPNKDSNFAGELEGYCAHRKTIYSVDE